MSDLFDKNLEEIASQFPYPPVPRLNVVLSHKTSRRAPALRYAWAMMIVVVIFGCLFAIPPIRAAILDILRIGVAQIIISETPVPTNAVPQELLEMEGETTLEQARQSFGYRLRWPRDFGEPDHLYVQQVENAKVAMMVWVDDDNPTEITLSLTHFNADALYLKKYVDEDGIQMTEVTGRYALWIDQPHVLEFQFHPRLTAPILVEGNVLLWTFGAVTYRLETPLAMEDAIAIAESVR